MKSPKCQVAILTLSFEPDLDHKAEVSPCGVQNMGSQYPGCKLYGAETVSLLQQIIHCEQQSFGCLHSAVEGGALIACSRTSYHYIGLLHL